MHRPYTRLVSQGSVKATYAYLAGAIDADGFITVYRKRGPQRKDGRRPVYYVAKIGLSETSSVIPRLLMNQFGGWLGMYRPKNPAHKPWHVWQATNKIAANAIRKVLPYLRLKRRQGELALRFVRLVKDQRVPPSGMSAKQEAARAEIWRQVTMLNQPRNRRVHFLGTP